MTVAANSRTSAWRIHAYSHAVTVALEQMSTRSEILTAGGELPLCCDVLTV
jgi:hypothetical protein